MNAWRNKNPVDQYCPVSLNGTRDTVLHHFWECPATVKAWRWAMHILDTLAPRGVGESEVVLAIEPDAGLITGAPGQDAATLQVLETDHDEQLGGESSAPVVSLYAGNGTGMRTTEDQSTSPEDQTTSALRNAQPVRHVARARTAPAARGSQAAHCTPLAHGATHMELSTQACRQSTQAQSLDSIDQARTSSGQKIKGCNQDNAL